MSNGSNSSGLSPSVEPMSASQVAHIIRSIGPEFAAYCEAIEREQIDGGVLTSLPFEDVASLLKQHGGVGNLLHLGRILKVLRGVGSGPGTAFRSHKRENPACPVCTKLLSCECVECEEQIELRPGQRQEIKELCQSSEGECGCEMHQHCLENWLRLRKTCPSHSDRVWKTLHRD